MSSKSFANFRFDKKPLDFSCCNHSRVNNWVSFRAQKNDLTIYSVQSIIAITVKAPVLYCNSGTMTLNKGLINNVRQSCRS